MNNVFNKLVNSIVGNRTIICMGIVMILKTPSIAHLLPSDIVDLLLSFFGTSTVWAAYLHFAPNSLGGSNMLSSNVLPTNVEESTDVKDDVQKETTPTIQN